MLLVVTASVSAQKITPFESWKTKDLAIANSARTLKDVSFQEKKVIFYINLARMNGKLFAETYLKDYMDDVKLPKNKFYRSLVKTLTEQDSMPPLEPQDDLLKEAIQHAKEMGRLGKKGHRSEDSKSFEERMEKYKTKYNIIRECNQYGYPDALSIVIDLLIDDDKESLNQRKALLNSELKYIGIGIRSHKKYEINTSILMGGG
ncbi:MAG: hypothetical protein A3K10_02190 [Bacteroidetes bacterium RIFCSPLOWO2_12_FULL_31_6]|nr:MAG: hypothetical protein A3K10_02190 [Bacteroidetes bacterium RIFCSPLOWO2_12_FULL_31_6]